jgi:hypothetical protein
MKKAKVMLTGIVVLAIVGGALAFKAKTTFSQDYCLGTIATNGACPTFAAASKVDAGSSVSPSFYTLTSSDACTGNCNGNASLKIVSEP